MKAARPVLALTAAALIVAGGYMAYRFGMNRGMQMGAPATASATPSEAGKKPLYWYDPMFPQHKFDQPGKSPFMDMQLVAKYAGEDAGTGTVAISARTAQNLGVRTGEAVAGSLERRFETVGTVAWNERAVVQLQARTAGFVERLYARAPLDPVTRAAGFVERLHARAPLDPVTRGAPLVELLVPEWTGAQEEFLLLRQNDTPGARTLAAAARQRLLLLGMSDSEIEAVEREGKARLRFTRYAPISGVIAELGVREGMTVMPGQTLFRIVDLATVWVNAEIPEAQAGMLVPGSRVEARVPAYPDQAFSGRVGAILPEVNMATRTVRARIELNNAGGRLKPGMFATLIFASGNGDPAVLVPSEALIRTGTRNVVILALQAGGFRAVDVEVGQESGGKAEIRKGLKPGDRVVLSGQFLIDSEASLSSTLTRLEGADSAPPASAPAKGAHRGQGTVTAVNPKAGQIELDHAPMPSIQWPAMKMTFKVENTALLDGLKPGDAVAFEMRGEPDSEGNYIIQRITPGGRP